MSHPLLLSHLPFTTSTSSSSVTLPSTTTQEHGIIGTTRTQQLREHPVHHAHLQAPSVDKLRHQESLWRERPAEWRKPAHHNSHKLCPKSLRLSQESKLILEIHINYLMYKKILEKQITEACGILKYQRRPTSNRTCTSTIPWKALQILNSKIESF